jgi:hypothetical protein
MQIDTLLFNSLGKDIMNISITMQTEHLQQLRLDIHQFQLHRSKHAYQTPPSNYYQDPIHTGGHVLPLSYYLGSRLLFRARQWDVSSRKDHLQCITLLSTDSVRLRHHHR